MFDSGGDRRKTKRTFLALEIKLVNCRFVYSISLKLITEDVVNEFSIWYSRLIVDLLREFFLTYLNN